MLRSALASLGQGAKLSWNPTQPEGTMQLLLQRTQTLKLKRHYGLKYSFSLGRRRLDAAAPRRGLRADKHVATEASARLCCWTRSSPPRGCTSMEGLVGVIASFRWCFRCQMTSCSGLAWLSHPMLLLDANCRLPRLARLLSPAPQQSALLPDYKRSDCIVEFVCQVLRRHSCCLYCCPAA